MLNQLSIDFTLLMLSEKKILQKNIIEDQTSRMIRHTHIKGSEFLIHGKLNGIRLHQKPSMSTNLNFGCYQDRRKIVDAVSHSIQSITPHV